MTKISIIIFFLTLFYICSIECLQKDVKILQGSNINRAIHRRFNQGSSIFASIAKSSQESSKQKSSSYSNSRAKTVVVEFKPSNIIAQAKEGDSLSQVAENAGVDIKYKCRKGECGTCKVKVQGKWIKACQTSVALADDEDIMRVDISQGLETDKPGKKPSKFFTAASFVEGVVNNGFGVLGFVVNSLSVDDQFKERMRKEEALKAKIAARKLEKDAKP